VYGYKPTSQSQEHKVRIFVK